MGTFLNEMELKSFLKGLPLIAGRINTKIGGITFLQQCQNVIDTYSDIFPVECGKLHLIGEM